MKKLLIPLLIFFCLTSWGQKDSTQINKKAVSFSFFAGPAINYRKSYSDVVGFSSTKGSSFAGYSYSHYAYYAKNEKPKLGYQLGFTVGFRLSNHSSIKMGLAVEKMGYKTQLIDTVYGKFVDNTFGSNTTSYSESANKLVIDYDFTFFSFPLLYAYSFNKKDFKFSPNLGFAFDAFYSSERIITYIGEQQNSKPQFPPDDLKVNYYWKDVNRPYYLSFMAGFEVEYLLNKRFTFSVEPQFKILFHHLNRKGFAQYENIRTHKDYLNLIYDYKPSDLYAFSLLFKINF